MNNHPVGFVNTGSLCYLNSLIQALLGCIPLNEYLIENEKDFRANKLINTYITILKKINTLNDNDNICLRDNIDLLKEILSIQQSKSQNANFGFSQEDASECFLLFLDSVNDKTIEKFFYHKYKCNIVCLDCNHNQQIENDTSCQFTLNQFDNDLSNYLRFNKSKMESYKCKNCNSEENIYKSNILLEIPPIIIIALNKFTSKFNANYPDNIIFNPQSVDKKLEYKLISCIEHYGNMFSGHYICKSTRQDKMYLFNDSTYTEISKLDINMTTYILVYVLVN